MLDRRFGLQRVRVGAAVLLAVLASCSVFNLIDQLVETFGRNRAM
jgi:hypothetical protein